MELEKMGLRLGCAHFDEGGGAASRGGDRGAAGAEREGPLEVRIRRIHLEEDAGKSAGFGASEVSALAVGPGRVWVAAGRSLYRIHEEVLGVQEWHGFDGAGEILALARAHERLWAVQGEFGLAWLSALELRGESDPEPDFGVASLAAEGETLRVSAWRGEELAGSEAIAVLALGPVWFDAAYHGIDRLELATDHYWQFVADDLLIRVP